MAKFKLRAGDVLKNEHVTSGALTALLIATVLIFNVAFFMFANALGLSFTVTEKDKVVLTGSTDVLFEEAIADKKTVKISFCYPSADEVLANSAGAFVHKTAEEYQKRYPGFIELEYINIITKMNSKGETVDMAKYMIDERTGLQNAISRATVIFECGNNLKVITDTYSSTGFADFYTLDSQKNATSYNGEAFMASMIHWVVTDDHPTAYFTMGHGEQADTSFGNLLSMAGYNVDTVDLKTEEVPEDAGLLIISNPVSDFERALVGSDTRSEIERLRTYIERGGNIYVSLDPYVRKLPVFESFISECGIGFSETKLEGGSAVRNIVKDSYNAITTDGFTLVTDYADNELSQAVKSRVEAFSDGSVIIREASALTLSGGAQPMLVTTPSSVIEADGKTVDKTGSYCVAAYNRIEAKDDKVASVFVVPSIYLSVSDALITNGYSNRDFIFSLFENFYGRNGLPYGCEVLLYDEGLLENLTMGTARIYTALILAVPAVLAIVGTAVVVKRKNR